MTFCRAFVSLASLPVLSEEEEEEEVPGREDPKPSPEPDESLEEMIFSSPTNAPAKTNRI